MSFLMSDILTTIQNLAANELGDLGEDVTAQNATIFRFTTVVLRKRVRQAYLVDTSDDLNITSDGDKTFLKSGVAITNMYEPLAIYDPTNFITNKRTSWDAYVGWWRDSENAPINTKGMTGNHYLKYLRYPAAVAASTDPVEFPLAAQWDIIMDVVALCKLPKNMYDENMAIKKQATGTATEKAAINARGSTNWSPPAMIDKEE